MNRLYTLLMLCLLAPASIWAHDEQLHKPNAVTGEIASVADDSFQLKTKTDTIKVTFSSKTKFEHGKEAVDKSHLKKGEPVGVIGTKLPTGELVAKEVLLGLPEPKKDGAHKMDQGDKAKTEHNMVKRTTESKSAMATGAHAQEISTPVGTGADGVVFARIRFDAPLKKEFVTRLKSYLDFLEETLP